MGGRPEARQRAWLQRHFVGRARELALLGDARRAQVVFVHGPAGIGKTTLLTELARRRHGRVTLLDARDLDPSPGALLQAIAGGGRRPTLENLFSGRERRLVLIDHYEQLQALDGWIRSSLLPVLPAGVRLVLANRAAPSTAWRAMPGWGALVLPLALRELALAEARQLLRARAAPEAQHAAIEKFTRGHPLAMVLAADFCACNPQVDFAPAAAPDVIHALLAQLVEGLPGSAQRAAVEACAVARHLIEPQLAAMLGIADAHAYFNWLRTLGFVHSGPSGLSPHELVREILIADLRWRNPEWHATLIRRAHDHNMARLAREPRSALDVIQDDMFLQRHDPAMANAFEWSDAKDLRAEAATPADVPALVAMVARHEGQESASHAAHWLGRQLDIVSVIRDRRRTPAGFLMQLALERAAPAERERDPATRAAWRYLRRHAPLRAGERAVHVRFAIARDTYQDVSPVQTLFARLLTRNVLTTPRLAFTFLSFADPEVWAEMQAHTEMQRIAEADFEVGGRRYGAYGHDWRRMPPLPWLAKMSARVAARAPADAALVPAAASAMPREAFIKAVRRCLRDLGRPEALRSNPLLRCRMVVARTGLDADLSTRIPVIAALVRDAAASLHDAACSARWYPAIDRTYLRPALTQALAAEQLGLPFSTFRRYLSAGVAQIAERLWQREIADCVGGSKART